MSDTNDFEFMRFGERGWLATCMRDFDDVTSGLFVNAIADAVRPKNGITDAIAGIDSIAIRFDNTQLDANDALKLLKDATKKTAAPNDTQPPDKTIEIPVLYGGDAGPDLESVCAQTKLTTDQLINKHASPPYRVITVGFAPGFAYMGPLDKALQIPRLATPRARVAAGSVAIAGGFTGVYALPSPGGWNIIGRTPVPLFDAARPSPFLFKPGTAVQFRPIDETEFQELSKQTP